MEEEIRQVAGCVVQPGGDGGDCGEPGGDQAVQGVVEVEDDGTGEGHGVGDELDGRGVIGYGDGGRKNTTHIIINVIQIMYISGTIP